MKAIILPVVGLAMLTSACSSPGTSTGGGGSAGGDAIGCATALFATGSTDPGVLARAALAAPACQALAADVLNGIINRVAPAQAQAVAARRMGAH